MLRYSAVLPTLQYCTGYSSPTSAVLNLHCQWTSYIVQADTQIQQLTVQATNWLILCAAVINQSLVLDHLTYRSFTTCLVCSLGLCWNSPNPNCITAECRRENKRQIWTVLHSQQRLERQRERGRHRHAKCAALKFNSMKTRNAHSKLASCWHGCCSGFWHHVHSYTNISEKHTVHGHRLFLQNTGTCLWRNMLSQWVVCSSKMLESTCKSIPSYNPQQQQWQ